jgi:hypothetical protein
MKNAEMTVSFDKLFKWEQSLPMTYMGGSLRERHLWAGQREPVAPGCCRPYLFPGDSTDVTAPCDHVAFRFSVLR